MVESPSTTNRLTTPKRHDVLSCDASSCGYRDHCRWSDIPHWWVWIYQHIAWYVSIDRTRDHHGPLTRYAKLRVVHAPGMPGTFSWPPTANQRSRHESRHVRHARAVTHVGIANSQWWGKRSRHSRACPTRSFAAHVYGNSPVNLNVFERLRLN